MVKSSFGKNTGDTMRFPQHHVPNVKRRIDLRGESACTFTSVGKNFFVSATYSVPSEPARASVYVLGIQGPHAVAVGGDNNDIIPWVDDQILDKGCGQVAAQHSPGLASILCHINTDIGPDVKDISADRIFLDDINRSQRDASGNINPGFTVIRGFPDVGLKIIFPFAVLRHINSAVIVSGGCDPADPFPIRKAFHYLIPGLSAVF